MWGKEKQGLDSAYFLVKENRVPYNYGYDILKTRLEREGEKNADLDVVIF